MDLKTIFSQGKKEWRRRRSISQDNSNLKSVQGQLVDQMTVLGRKAWEEKVDINAFPEIKTLLETNQGQLDDLKSKAEDCQKRKEAGEQEKKSKNEEFVKERRGVEEKKKEADSKLNSEKEILKNLQKNLSQAESRSDQIAKERNQLQDKIANANTTVEQRTEHENKLKELAAEEAGLLDSRREQSASIKTQEGKIQPLQAESDALQKQVEEILKRQKETVSAIDQKLGEIRKELDAHQAKTKELEKSQTESHRMLGEKLAAGGSVPAGLDSELVAVRECEQKIETIKIKLADLDSQQSEEGSSAYRRMLTIIVGGTLLVIALIVAAVILLSPKNKPRNIVEELSRGNLTEAIGGMMAQATSESPEEIKKSIEKMQEGVNAIREASEQKIGKGEAVASEKELTAVLSPVPDWEMTPCDYSSMNFSGIDTASLRTTYQDNSGRTVQVEITDTHSVSVLLAPSQALLMSGMVVDDEQIYQKSGKLGDHPMIESLDKQDHTARITLIVKERYLVNLETTAENGIELLKTFAGRMNLDQLD